VANIVVYIELCERAASATSLSLLNAARGVASELGGTLHALLPCDAPPSYGNDDIIAVLSRHGADKVVLVTGPSLAGPALYATHGPALQAACAQLQPRLLLFPASAAGEELAPRVAVQLGANYFASARVVRMTGASSALEYHLTCDAFRRRYRCATPLRAAGRAIATIVADAPPRPLADDEAEVVVIHGPSAAAPGVHVRGQGQAPGTDLACARIVVSSGAGLKSAAEHELAARLAAALGAAHGATGSASEQGLVGAPRVGLDGTAVAAQLFLAIGSSGSERHLAGLAPSTVVVAVNSDPGAPIFESARYGLVGDGAATIEALLLALEGAEAAR
jgi:electron transfer flavoprotein alpha subunit